MGPEQISEDKMLPAEKDYILSETFSTNFMVTTKHKSRAEALNIKREMREA